MSHNLDYGSQTNLYGTLSSGANTINLAGLSSGTYVIIAVTWITSTSAGYENTLYISVGGTNIGVPGRFNGASSGANHINMTALANASLTSSSLLAITISAQAFNSGRYQIIRIG